MTTLWKHRHPAITVLDDTAGVGPIKHTRISFAGDAAYAAGGSLGIAKLLDAHFNERRTIIAAAPSGPNAGQLLEYTPRGKSIPATVVANAALFTAPNTFVSGQPVEFLADDVGNGNLPDPLLPAGLVAGTTYYVLATGLTSTTFEVSASQGAPRSLRPRRADSFRFAPAIGFSYASRARAPSRRSPIRAPRRTVSRSFRTEARARRAPSARLNIDDISKGSET